MPEAIIWGASGGMGNALLQLLKQNGWKVYGVARDESRIAPAADFTCEFNANSPFSIQEAATVIAYETEGIDLVVYAAGGIQVSPLEDTDDELWFDIINANLTGAQLAIRSSINLLKADGHVAVIGAQVDNIKLPKFGAYTIAKAGLEPMLAIYQKEHRKLKFTLVQPGAVATPFWDNVPFNLPKGALEPEAVAQAVFDAYNNGTKGTVDV